MNNRSSIASLALYVAVVALLIGGVGAALALISTSLPTSSEVSTRTKTPFELQLESAREVKAALAKPIPAPAPLAPITAKLQKPITVAARPAPKRNMDVAMLQARQAFESVDPPAPRRPQSFFELAFGVRD